MEGERGGCGGREGGRRTGRKREKGGDSPLSLTEAHPLTDVSVSHVRFLLSREHGDGAVCLGRQHVHEGIGVLVEGHGGVGLE